MNSLTNKTSIKTNHSIVALMVGMSVAVAGLFTSLQANAVETNKSKIESPTLNLKFDLFEQIKNKTYDAYFNIRESSGITDEVLYEKFNLFINSLPKNFDVIEKHIPLTRSFDQNIIGMISADSVVRVVEQIPFDEGNYLAVRVSFTEAEWTKHLQNETIQLRNENRGLGEDESQSQSQFQSNGKEYYLVFTREELLHVYGDRIVKNHDGFIFNTNKKDTGTLEIEYRKYLMLEAKVEEEETVYEKLQTFVEDSEFTDFFNPSKIYGFMKDSLGSLFESEIEYVKNHMSLLKSNSKEIHMVISKRCGNFIDLEHAYEQQEWGQYIEKRILSKQKEDSSEYSGFLNPEYVSDLKNYCSNYPEMNSEEKAKVWTWIILSMANAESSCRADVVVKGTNDKAVGLLQLPASKKYLEGSGGEVCKNINPKNPFENLECGLHMLNVQFERYNKLFLSSEDRKNKMKSYWQVLMGHQEKVQSAFSFYTPCK